MIEEAILLQMIIGGLGGLLGSLLHILWQRKLSLNFLVMAFSIKEGLANSVGWTMAAMFVGLLFGANNPIWGFVIGLLTGVFGVEGYKTLILLVSKDQRFAWLLERNKGLLSLQALEDMLKQFPFVKDIKIIEKIGEIDISIIPEAIYNSTVHLPMLLQMLNNNRPIGVKMNLTEPSPIVINVTAQLHIEEGYVFEAVKTKVEQHIRDYIDGLGMGNEFKLPVLQAAFMTGEVEGVLDLYNIITTPQVGERKTIYIPPEKMAKAGTITINPK